MNEEKRKAETEAEVRYRLVVSRELDDINVHDHDFLWRTISTQRNIANRRNIDHGLKMR